MTSRKIPITSMAFALTLGALTACDQMGSSEGTASAEAELNRFDADSNGELSQAEVAGTDLEEQFAILDADGNGVISAEEFEAGYGIGGPASGTGGVEGPAAGAGSETEMPEAEQQEGARDPAAE